MVKWLVCSPRMRSGQTKDYTICIYFFSAKHAALKRKTKDWSALLPKSKCGDQIRLGARALTGWLGIRMWNNTCRSSTKQTPWSCYGIKLVLVMINIAENCPFCAKQQSITHSFKLFDGASIRQDRYMAMVSWSLSLCGHRTILLELNIFYFQIHTRNALVFPYFC